MAKVGIVMPAYYQHEPYIREAVRSILTQTYRDFKLVIVVDGAAELIPLFRSLTLSDPRVSIVSYAENQGVAYALNHGFEIIMDSGCEYLTWVSTDNIYYPDFLEVLVKDMDRAPAHVGIVYSAFRYMLENGIPALTQKMEDDVGIWQNRPKEALFDGCIIGPCFLQRAKFCRLLDGYRFKFIQDYDYWIRLTDYCDIRFNPKLLMNYRLNSPYSLSTHINVNPANFRLCWNEVHQSHYDTRLRRGIRPFLTTMFIVRPGEAQLAQEKLATVVDQFETNLEILIVSLTTQKELESVIAPYDDPRIRVLYYPYHDDFHAISKALVKVRTEWCILFDSAHTTDNRSFIRAVKESGKMKHSKVAITMDNDLVKTSPVIGQLYLTVATKKAFGELLGRYAPV